MSVTTKMIGPMDAGQFWSIIGDVRSSGESQVEVRNRIYDLLWPFPIEELVEFEVQQSRLSIQAWQDELLMAFYIMFDFWSEDVFGDFISGVVFQGRNFYEHALYSANTFLQIDPNQDDFLWPSVNAIPYEIMTIKIEKGLLSENEVHEIEERRQQLDEPAPLTQLPPDSEIEKCYPKLWSLFRST